MIVLNLCCDNGHMFEGWFASADAFDAQRERQQVACPTCGSTGIERRPTAPYLNTRAAAPARAATPSTHADHAAALVAMLRKFGRESEDVGDRFAEEARRIHHGERDARNIKGKASRDDVGELLDEGIVVLPLPADEDVH